MRSFAVLCLAFLAYLPPILGAGVAPVDPAHLKPGEYLWYPEVAPAGPVVAIVSLDEQRVYVYRNGVAIGLSTISSGDRKHETPPGIYTILEKDRDHHSNLYDDAPMPFMERLTWSGVALHGGALPGYPASHGCVRLPKAFAESLFAITQRGDTVVIAEARVSPAAIVHPAVLAPLGSRGEPEAQPADDESYWDESLAPSGPVSILASLQDRRVYVLRNGVRIGWSTLEVTEGFSIGGTLLFTIEAGYDPDASSPLDKSRPRHRWNVYRLPGRGTTQSVDALAANLRLPDPFARALYGVLTPGTTVVLTDLPAFRNSEPQPLLHVLESPPQ
jgi:hypothetical protein